MKLPAMFAKGNRKKLLLICLAAIIVSAGTVFLFTYLVRGERRADLAVSIHRADSNDAPGREPGTLRLMTLNLAHGRSSGPHQLFQSGERIKGNLFAVTQLLVRERPDVVGLQEADGPSVWSGRMNHVAMLADAAGFAYSTQAANVDGIGLSYGTAIISRLPLLDPIGITFAPSPPTFSKGLTLVTVEWPSAPGVMIDIVSVHLDFSRAGIRAKQVREIVHTMGTRLNPLVVMGDFNCDWNDSQSAVQVLARDLDLCAFQPEDQALATFPSTGRRLDWILVDPRLEITSYTTLPDNVSDHLAVVCEIRLKKQ